MKPSRESGAQRWRPSRLLVALLVAGAIARLLWTPSQRAQPSFWLGFFCNGGHAFLFALQTWPLLSAAPRTRRVRASVFALVITWAGVTEWVQLSVGRDGSVGDFVTDVFGVYFAWASLAFFERPERRRAFAAHAALAVALATISALVETLRR